MKGRDKDVINCRGCSTRRSSWYLNEYVAHNFANSCFLFYDYTPAKKREKENREMLASLAVGDNVTTIGGICGKITSLREDIVIIEVGVDKVKLVFERWAIRKCG